MEHIYVASHTEDGGIYHYTLVNGRLSFCGKSDVFLPMYMAVSDGRLYVITERIDNSPHGNSGILSYKIETDGSLSDKSDAVSTDGRVSCHLSVRDGLVYDANYSSGSVNLLGRKTITHSGHGVNMARQEMPHVHYTGFTPDGRYLLACDLGLDTVFVYDQELREICRTWVPDGHGIRHLAFSADGMTMYGINELTGTVTTWNYEEKGGNFTRLDTVATLPESFTGVNTSAAIRVSGDRLYVSHRGHDSIAILDISDRIPKLIKWIDVHGRGPRDFDIFGNTLISANEGTGNVAVFSVDGDKITFVETHDCPAALCVVGTELT